MPFRRTPSLSYPDAEHVAHEEPLVHALAVGEVHEEVVERGADPGRDAGDDVDVGQVRNVDLPPGQHGGQRSTATHQQIIFVETVIDYCHYCLKASNL